MFGYGIMRAMHSAAIQEGRAEGERLRALHGPAPLTPAAPLPPPVAPLRRGWWRRLFTGHKQ